MQYRMTFSCSVLTLPLACQYQVQSMFYRMLCADAGLGRSIHPRDGVRRIVPYCLGPLEGDKRVVRSRRELIFERTVALEVRTAGAELGTLLERLLRPGLTLTLCGQPLTLEDVRREERGISANRCRVELLSPLLAYRRAEGNHTKFYDPLDPEFAAVVEENYRRKYHTWRAGASGRFSIEPESVGWRDKVVTRYKDTWLTGWKGVYRLTGTPEGLSLLYDAGLGQRNGAGFGMFRVLPER